MTFYKPAHPPLTLEALVAWLQQQPPDTEYIFQDPARCVLGQYLTAHHAEEAISEAAYETIPNYYEVARPKPHTFQAALERAKPLLLEYKPQLPHQESVSLLATDHPIER